MATRPSLFRHGHDAVLRAWNGPPDEQQVPVRVDLHHPEPKLGVALRAHMTGHTLSFDYARRVGARTDGPGLPVPRVAVGSRAAAESMAVDNSLKSAALGGAGDLHQLARGKDVDFHFGPRRGRFTVDGEYSEHLGRGLEARLLGVSQL